MGLTKDEKERFERLAQQYHIQRVEQPQPVQAEGPEPQHAIRLFIQELDDLQFDDYRDENDRQILPLRQRKLTTRRATKLVSDAERLRLTHSGANPSRAPKEITWRFKTEIPIFQSLEITTTW
jgi:hypothetical protein